MSRLIFYPYKMGSKSPRLIQERTNQVRCLRVRENGRYRPKPTDVVINWGNPRIPAWSALATNILNRPEAVNAACDKLTTARFFAEHRVPQPEFTEDEEVARQWQRDGHAIMARTLLRASAGRGLEYIYPDEEPPPAPLYTKYIKKMDEFRIHVFNGQVIDFQQKKRRNGFEEINNQIRSHANGWVFCRNDIDVPDSAVHSARAAITALGLDFGAVDVIHNRHYNQSFVLEVNTAPGLEGTTLDNYVQKIHSLIEGD